MDKNTFIGFLLIAMILFGFMWLGSDDEKAEREAKVEQELQQAQKKQEALLQNNILTEDVTTKDSAQLAAERFDRYGAFAMAGEGEETFQTVETDLLRVKFSSKGGQIASVELKEYLKNDKTPLILFDGTNENNYGFMLVTANNRVLNTADLYFEPLPVVQTDSVQKVTMRLRAGNASYIDFIYSIRNNDYMLGFDVVTGGMENILSANVGDWELRWSGKIRQQEKGRTFEERYSGLFYKFLVDDVEQLSESESEEKRITNRLHWIAFKDQFFSTVLIADDQIASANLESVVLDASSPYLKECFARASVPVNLNGKTSFHFYFGPNHFQTLNSYNNAAAFEENPLNLEKLVPLGWALFRWINRWAVIPMFNFFSSFIGNFGIIILLMTVVIKLILFPLTYKSYISAAKMRVLKPEIEKVTAKISADKPQERQRATMEVYRRVGVNPMGGCLPMLLQMPILVALFQFFPSAIELRQQSFLWADDLSTYDAVLTFGFNIPWYGNHVSLFCLLMTIVNIIYTRINMATQEMGGQQMPGMKYIMYLMPLMFLFFFNDYASGLSYYYLVSLLITILQTLVIRATVDEEKLLKQLTDSSNKKKPAKKSGFMARLEEAQRKQMEAQRRQQNKR